VAEDVEEESDNQFPTYEGSIKVPTPEPADLSSMAKITVDDATAAVLKAYPGAKVVKVELDNENGVLVYSVELNNGTDVKVDAGNGEILHVEKDDVEE